jgi:YHS domain-containing protein
LIRKLIVLLAIVGIWVLATRIARMVAGKPAAPHPHAPSAPRFEGDLVRDRVCGTFVPRAKALSLRSGDEEHFFCSAGCRDRFVEISRAPSS